jgi:hypothetical protein
MPARPAYLLIALGIAIGVSTPALAEPPRRAPPALYVQLALGPAYVTNETAGSGSGYDPNDHSAAGFTAQLEFGVRLHRFVSLQGMHFVDVGAPERSGLTPLYRFGMGLGATLHLHGFQLGLNAGAQLTSYMNYVDDPSVGMGADVGPFVSASAGYVFALTPTFTLGAHGVGRYHHSTDNYMGTNYDPQGYTLGGLISIGFAGPPALRKSPMHSYAPCRPTKSASRLSESSRATGQIADRMAQRAQQL